MFILDFDYGTGHSGLFILDFDYRSGHIGMFILDFDYRSGDIENRVGHSGLFLAASIQIVQTVFSLSHYPLCTEVTLVG